MDRFEKTQKFYAGMAFFLLNGLFCWMLKVDGVVYQTVAVAIVVSMLASQAVVEWKNK